MNRLYEFFYLSRKERRGVFVLCCFLAAAIVLPPVYTSFGPKETIAYSLVNLPADDGFAGPAPHIEPVENEGLTPQDDRGGQHRIELFHFDPNGLSIDDWRRLGLTAKQAQVIKNYEAKGGRFRTKEDVRKMFVISAERYAILEPYIRISEENVHAGMHTESKRVSKERKGHVEASPLIDINTADTALWMSLRGIGPVYANRIVRFRDALGGFYAIEQLKEVYGISEEVFNDIQSRLVLQNPVYRKIEINSCSVGDLRRHPYISHKQAQAIVRYRQQHGPFSSIEDLRKIVILDGDFLRKIEPYLIF